jgi:hypothetical protein
MNIIETFILTIFIYGCITGIFISLFILGLILIIKKNKKTS